ncbi:MAG TPA: TolC family protein [Solirubrobacteraceae bacterium]|nr:TolC family protein [Solirubrobacteraceae bacterium]
MAATAALIAVDRTTREGHVRVWRSAGAPLSSAETDGSSLAERRNRGLAASYGTVAMRTPRPGLTLALALAAAAVVGSAPATVAAQESTARVVTLAQAERTALAQQPQMLVARAATGVAEAQADVAKAPLLPQVTGSASYTRETGNFAPRPGAIPGSNGAAPTTSLSASYDYWNFGLTATQLIYDFGQTFGKYHAAEASADATRFTEHVTRLQVVFGVRRAYFTARANKELVGVARETLDNQQKHLTQVQGFVQVGTQPEIALAQQKAAVANAQVALINAQNGYETAKAQLNQAAGIPGDTEYDVDNEAMAPVEDEDQPLETLVTKAVAARPELASIAKQRVAQEETLSATKGGYGPTLSAGAGANAAGVALDGLVPNWNVGLVLAWPIYQGGLTRAQVRAAEAGLQSVDAQRSLEELQVRLDVDTARLAVRAAKATISASDDALASARDQLHLAEGRYATGVGNIIELNDAQVAYTNAAAQAVQARFSLASARAQLMAALGRT